MQPNKAEVIAALRAAVDEELAAVERIAAAARDEATGDESRSEGKYDTRATEASYLARGQAQRVVALRGVATWLGSVAGAPAAESARVGALVALEGAREELLLIAPVGGARASAGGRRVRMISPASPLGRAMAGLETGDDFVVETPRGARAFEIVEIA